MKGIARRQKTVVKANVHRQKFDIEIKKLRDELRRNKKASVAAKKNTP